MPTSSESRVRRWTRFTPATITAAPASAPTTVDQPRRNASAMPGSTPWASASPMKDSPRITTQVPMTAVVTAAASPASRASCMKRGWNAVGSRSSSQPGRTSTAADGTYVFDNRAFPLEPGVAYRVRAVLPSGASQTTDNPARLTFSRGETFSGVDFGIATGPKLTSTTGTSAGSSPTSGGSVVTDSGGGRGPLDSLAGVVDIVRALGLAQ